MTKAAVFTMKLEPELRDDFMAAAEASHRPAPQVMRELMREFIQRRQTESDHSDFVQRKVAAARRSARADAGRSNQVVDADFAARRAGVTPDA